MLEVTGFRTSSVSTRFFASLGRRLSLSFESSVVFKRPRLSSLFLKPRWTRSVRSATRRELTPRLPSVRRSSLPLWPQAVPVSFALQHSLTTTKGSSPDVDEGST